MKKFEWTLKTEWREETSGLSPKLYQFTDRSKSKPEKPKRHSRKAADTPGEPDALFVDAVQLATLAAAAYGAWRAAK